jgi:exodeoxyribonuclease V alpha subunit
MSVAWGPGALDDADVALARTLARLWPAARNEHLLLAALASHATSTGDTCLDLDALDAGAWREDARFAGVDAQAIRAAARDAPFVGAGDDRLPLVREGARRIYLRRYHRYELDVARAVLARASAAPVEVAPELVAAWLGPAAGGDPDRQRIALALAARRRLLVLCGGPGTGKTWTIARMVGLWRALHGPDFRITLAAPTGKAAARLGEALHDAGQVAEALTLHRLLGQRPHGTRSARHAGDPLALDALVVDECSMVDLPLMARLLDALPALAHLVLVGDPDQLPAVETGAVLHALAERGGAAAASPAESGWLAAATGTAIPARSQPQIDDAVVHLTRRHRFDARGAIGAMLDHVRRGDVEKSLEVLRAGDSPSLLWLEPSRHPAASLRDLVAERFAPLQQAPDAVTALRELERFRVLCALREGASGTGGLNPWIARRAIRPPARVHPVLIQSNDPATGLFNGDVGVAWGPDQVWFDMKDGPKAFERSRLPLHDDAFAMTVHKAQGSEFDEVLVVLPPRPHPLLTRAWLYTALSRARRRVVLYAEAPVVQAAILLQGTRASGLPDRLEAGQESGR